MPSESELRTNWEHLNRVNHLVRFYNSEYVEEYQNPTPFFVLLFIELELVVKISTRFSSLVSIGNSVGILTTNIVFVVVLFEICISGCNLISKIYRRM